MANIHYHLLELKWRLFYLIFSAICTFIMCYNYQIEIVYVIGKPFLELQQTFIFLELTEAFYTLLKISTILTGLVLIPLCVYQIWSFFIPSFYEIERTSINLFFLLFLFFFVNEVLFTYFLVLPKICHFLISFEMTSQVTQSGFHIDPVISVEFTAQIGSYVKLIVKICSILLFLFQIPLCVCFLYSKRILHVSSLYCNRKFLSLFSLLLSAFIVPPDVVSQLVVAVFFYILFEFLIFIGLFFD